MLDFKIRGVPELKARAAKYRKSAEALPGKVQSANVDIAEVLLRHVRAAAPNKSGALASGLDVDFSGSGLNWKIKLVSSAPHTDFVLYGTKAHIITPKSKRALAFSSKGQQWVVRYANHPGTKPNRFDKKGLEAAKPEIRARIQRLKESVIEK